MAWTTPKTWIDGNKLEAAELNEQVRDNLSFLFSKPGASYSLDEGADYTTTSALFTDIDGTNLGLSITSGGGDLLVWFSGTVAADVGIPAYIYLDVDLDGSRVGGDDGLVMIASNTSGTANQYQGDKWNNIVLLRLLTGLAAGTHTLSLQWKVLGTSGATARLYAGAGTAITYGTVDIHSQFGVKEL